MQLYKFVEKYGYLVSVGFATLLVLIGILVYQATTYVVLEDGSRQELESYMTERKKAAANRQAERKKANEERIAEQKEAGGIFSELTPEQKEYNAKVEKLRAKNEKEELAYDIAAKEKVGNVNFLIQSLYIILVLACIVAFAFPLRDTVVKAIQGEYKSLAITLGPVLFLIILYYILKAVSDDGGHPDGKQVNGLLVLTYILLAVGAIGIVGGEIRRSIKG